MSIAAMGAYGGIGSRSPDVTWSDLTASGVTASRALTPQRSRLVATDYPMLRLALAQAPREGSVPPGEGLILALPLPDGTSGRFAIVEAPILPPGLSARHPAIHTYAGHGLDDRSARAHLDLTPAGFHAFVLSDKGAFYIDPLQRGDVTRYQSYYARDFVSDKRFICGVAADLRTRLIGGAIPGTRWWGGTLRTYRAAVAATGEYTNYMGGSIEAALAAVTTTLWRVDGIYESELSIRLALIDGEDSIIYLDANTDPYTNNDGQALLTENQSNLDTVIGDANYDIGHVFSTGGGGLAVVGCVCQSGTKAQGETGSSDPYGDPFDVDYVSHEMGHQFGATHTFNSVSGGCGGGHRSAATAYEPGSGSTIMGYAGLCDPDNLQPHTDPYFAWISGRQILAYVGSGQGGTCAAESLLQVVEPSVSAGSGGFTIPRRTPFKLTATALTTGQPVFCWEESDTGPEGPPDLPVGNAPIFRSFHPQGDPSRTFPRTEDLLPNQHTIGELLPAYERDLSFKVTVRDIQSGGTGIACDSIAFHVGTAGPFAVTSPDQMVSWPPDSVRTVTWDVAGTDQPPVNCQRVNIRLSTDGGQSFPILLASGVLNNGSAQVTVPDLLTSHARVKVEAADNVFFDISIEDFEIRPPTDEPGAIVMWPQDPRFVVPAPNRGFTAVSAGLRACLGLRADSSIAVWGDTLFGAYNIPSPNSGFTAVAAGDFAKFGLKRDGSIVAWGDNHYGELDIPAPNADFVAISAGWDFVLGLKRDSSVVAWGCAERGRLNVPPPNTDFVAVSAGPWYSLGLKRNGSIVAWGYTDYYNCEIQLPVPDSGFVAISAGLCTPLGLKRDGAIVSLGGTALDGPDPNAGYVGMATDGFYTFGLKPDGSLAGTDYAPGAPPPNSGFASITWGCNSFVGLRSCIGPFSLESPAPADTIYTTQPSLVWLPASVPEHDQVRYVAYWSTQADFSDADSSEVVDATSFTVPWQRMQVGNTYYWRVRARDNLGFKRWCDPAAGASFYIQDDQTPVLLQPQARAREDGILLSWAVPGGSGLTGFNIYRREPPADPGSGWTCIAPQLPSCEETCSYFDTKVEPGVEYEYEVEGLGPGGPAGRFGPVTATAMAPLELALRLAPNPATGTMKLSMALPKSGDVTLRVFNAQGREVARRLWPALRAGLREAQWDVRDAAGHPLPSGTYWTRMEAASGRRTARWVVVK